METSKKCKDCKWHRVVEGETQVNEKICSNSFIRPSEIEDDSCPGYRKVDAKDLIRSIESNDFECIAGNLVNCQEWIELKRLVLGGSKC